MADPDADHGREPAPQLDRLRLRRRHGDDLETLPADLDAPSGQHRGHVLSGPEDILRTVPASEPRDRAWPLDPAGAADELLATRLVSAAAFRGELGLDLGDELVLEFSNAVER